MEREQKRREEVEKQKGNKIFSTKTKYSSKHYRDTIVIDIIVSNLAKKTESPTVGTSRAYPNRVSRKNKCGHYKPATTVDRVHTKV